MALCICAQVSAKYDTTTTTTMTAEPHQHRLIKLSSRINNTAEPIKNLFNI